MTSSAAELALTPAPGSIRAARQMVRRALTGPVDPEVVRRAEACTSELVTNALVYQGGGQVVVRVARDGDSVRVEVEDEAGGWPVQRAPSAGEVSGRGLLITEHLSSGWGVDRLAHGRKLVWCEIRADG